MSIKNKTIILNKSLAQIRLSSLGIITKNKKDYLKLINKVRSDRFDPDVINPVRRKDKMNEDKKILNRYKKLVKEYNNLNSYEECLIYIKKRKTKIGLVYDSKKRAFQPMFIIPEALHIDEALKSKIYNLTLQIRNIGSSFKLDSLEIIRVFIKLLGIESEIREINKENEPI